MRARSMAHAREAGRFWRGGSVGAGSAESSVGISAGGRIPGFAGETPSAKTVPDRPSATARPAGMVFPSSSSHISRAARQRRSARSGSGPAVATTAALSLAWGAKTPNHVQVGRGDQGGEFLQQFQRRHDQIRPAVGTRFRRGVDQGVRPRPGGPPRFPRPRRRRLPVGGGRFDRVERRSPSRRLNLLRGLANFR